MADVAPVTMVEAVAALLVTMSSLDEHATVLAAAARALALEVDMAQVADDNGRVRPASSAVRELRAVLDELQAKGRADDEQDDWTASPGAAPVRDGAKRKADVRPRGRGGGSAAR